MNAKVTTIFSERITHPHAWDAASLGGKAGATLAVDADTRDALIHFLRQRRDIPCQTLRTEHIDAPEIHRLAARIRQALYAGCGVAVVADLSRKDFVDADLTKIFWLLGILLGIPAVQNTNGSRLTSVRLEAHNPKDRGYLSNRELGFHSDAFEILGLLCCQKAYRGGLTQVVSGLSIHNELLATRPETLPALYHGYYYATAERKGDITPVTDYRVPVFSCVDGQVSSMCVGAYMRAAAVCHGKPFPPELDDALKVFYALCQDHRFLLEFMLEPGEMLFLNNFTTLHSRTAFENTAEQQRHLMRLWLNVPDGRPVVSALHERGKDYERLHTHRDAYAEPPSQT